METYIILGRLSPDAFTDPKIFKKFAATVSEKIKSEYPGVIWKNSYATLGRFDVADIFTSDGSEKIEKAAMIICSYGHSTTKMLLATLWDEFLETL